MTPACSAKVEQIVIVIGWHNALGVDHKNAPSYISEINDATENLQTYILGNLLKPNDMLNAGLFARPDLE